MVVICQGGIRKKVKEKYMLIGNIFFVVGTIFFGYYILKMFDNMNKNLAKIELRFDDMLKNRLDSEKKAE